MKKNFFALMLLWSMSMLQLNAAGPNPAMKKEYSFKGFDTIRTVYKEKSLSGRGTFLSSVYRVTLIKSDHYKVEMSVFDRDDLDMFEIRKNGNALELMVDIGKYPYHTSKSAPSADVIIYAPELNGVVLSGGSSMSVSGGDFSGESLSVKLSGAAKLSGLSGTWNRLCMDMCDASKAENIVLKSKSCSLDCSGASVISGMSSISADLLTLQQSGATSLSFGKVQAGTVKADFSGAAKCSITDVDAGMIQAGLSGSSHLVASGKISSVSVDMSGASVMTLSGEGKTMNVVASGVSNLKSKDFRVKEAKLELSGAAGVVATVSDKIAVETSGRAHVDYYGHPANVECRSDNVRER